MAEIREQERTRASKAANEPGAARLYALLIGGFLSLLGVLGFFYDSSFGTGSSLASDDLAGVLLVNGWRNVAYLATGLLALALAAVRPRAIALGLGIAYAAYGIWGLAETERGLGSILDALPLADRDNALHLIVGGLGIVAFLADGGLPARPRARSERAARRRSPAGPRSGAGA